LEDSVANTKSAIKRTRSSERKRLRNRRVTSATRTEIKKARRFMEAGQIEEAEQSARRAVSLLDKAAEKGIIHRRNAARRKSRLMHALHRAQQEAA
jgi:small subunit ribosomal protein S20